MRRLGVKSGQVAATRARLLINRRHIRLLRRLAPRQQKPGDHAQDASGDCRRPQSATGCNRQRALAQEKRRTAATRATKTNKLRRGCEEEAVKRRAGAGARHARQARASVVTRRYRHTGIVKRRSRHTGIVTARYRQGQLSSPLSIVTPHPERSDMTHFKLRSLQLFGGLSRPRQLATLLCTHSVHH